jgi:hypothetical protein
MTLQRDRPSRACLKFITTSASLKQGGNRVYEVYIEDVYVPHILHSIRQASVYCFYRTESRGPH